MSQETTQDDTQFQSVIDDDLQEDLEDDAECIATMEYESNSVFDDERLEIALYTGQEIRIGRESHLQRSTSRRTFQSYVINDDRVSKKHFRIYSIIYEQKKSHDTETPELPPLVYCEDLESSNGTYVNGHLIGIIGKEKVAHLLCDGDVIEIRPSWNFTFHQSNHHMIFPTTIQSRDMEYFLDRYTVSDRLLGSGNYGKVYLGTELTTNKQIACKVIDLDSAVRNLSEAHRDNSIPGLGWRSGLESAKKQRRKIMLEIEILSKITHPNVINLKKAFCSNHALYIFTDLAPAGDLFSYAQSHGGHLDDYNTRVVTLQIALAVEYLHSEGIAHRDIKQENVLVTTTDFGGRVLLTDFGFATYIKVGNGRMMSKVGTEGFVAPEVENVHRAPLGYTKAADLWSLGVLTASLLTGDLMIPREELSQLSQVEIANRFLQVDDNYTRHQWTKMPPRALRFLRRLLVVDPEERMTAAEAVNHSWYTQPASEAEALADGIKRINRFWRQRDISGEEVLEGLPGVVFSTPPGANDIPGPKFRRKIPDATSSPYFGLDRHLTQKGPSRRKRLLEDLNESGSPFVKTPAPQKRKSVVNTGAQRGKGLGRNVSVDGTDLFRMSPLKTKTEPYESQAEIEIVDLDSTSPAPESGAVVDIPGLRSATRALRSEKLSGRISRSPKASISSRTDRSENDRFSDRKRSQKVWNGESRTPGSASKDSPRYTSAEALRNTVRKIKL